ncbi:MAG: HAD-IIIA family hydrolase [Oligoflexia bacterium]|nr:HAD-IIIA family hydrolase [Oligoflexia bacterium]
MKSQVNKAIFFDKDGVLNPDVDNIYDVSLDFFDYVPFILGECKKRGFHIVMVTNQPIVARGYISEDELFSKLLQFKHMIEKRGKRKIFDGIYFCPHHPQGTVKKYRKDCLCRKPGSQMLRDAAENLDIDLSHSYLVGDRVSDLVAGNAVRCKTILCKTGKHSLPMIKTNLLFDEKFTYSNYAIDNLESLLEFVR